MKQSQITAALLLALAATAPKPTNAADAPLAPNAILQFEFPELPESYYAKQKGEKALAMLTAQLPENYSSEAKFPLFVYLQGGNGGRSDSAAFARSVVGPRDFIAVRLPLFKTDAGSSLLIPEGLLSAELAKRAKALEFITANDFSVTARAYQTMLSKLFDAVPNATRERSAIGGFSNGAHCVSALLILKDDFLLDHFTSFYFLDGGQPLLIHPDALKDPRAHRSRYLLLRGDPAKDDLAARQLIEPMILAFDKRAQADGLDFTSILMTGHGHTQPPEYLQLIGAWARGEALPNVGKE